MILEIGNTVFQQGRPQVAVSLTGATPEDIIEQCKEAVAHPVDVIEWRADYYFNDKKDLDKKLVDKEIYLEIVKILDDINYIVEGRPVIFTIRSEKQGGLGTLNEIQLESVHSFVAETGFADIIDIEVVGPNKKNGGINGPILEERIEMIHDKGCKVALSYHDFDGMPEAQDIVRLIMDMAGYGADMFKVAAMSHSKEDSTALLKATAYLTKKEIGPVVTMAMGPEGVITRIVGGKYGSVMTFASVGQTSAPGQISADIMKKKLDDFYGE